MNLPYDPTVPVPSNDPGDDVNSMQSNTGSIGTWAGIDHYGYSNNSGGYHKLIHQPNQTVGGQAVWIPNNVGIRAAIQATKITGIQQTFPLLYTPDTTGGVQDTQLFTMTGRGGISQLTGNLATSDGWNWLGGILIQWGTVSVTPGAWPTTNQIKIFKDRSLGCIPFPNSCFSIVTNFIGPSSGTNSDRATISIVAKSSTQFTWVFCPSSSSTATFTGFYWIAIGN